MAEASKGQWVTYAGANYELSLGSLTVQDSIDFYAATKMTVEQAAQSGSILFVAVCIWARRRGRGAKALPFLAVAKDITWDDIDVLEDAPEAPASAEA